MNHDILLDVVLVFNTIQLSKTALRFLDSQKLHLWVSCGFLHVFKEAVLIYCSYRLHDTTKSLRKIKRAPQISFVPWRHCLIQLQLCAHHFNKAHNRLETWSRTLSLSSCFPWNVEFCTNSNIHNFSLIFNAVSQPGHI